MARRVLVATVLCLAWLAGTAMAQEEGPWTLPRALDQALARDARLAGARASAQAARAQQRQADGRLWPSTGLRLTQGRSSDRDPPFVLERTTRRGEAFVRWNLFNGLGDQRQIAAQAFDAVAAEADLLQALDEACERIAAAYFALLRQQHLAGLARQRLREVERLAARVASQAALGKAPDADAQLAEASRIDAQLALQGIEAEGRAARARLAVLLGLPDGAGLQVAEASLPPADAGLELREWAGLAERQNGQWLAAAARVAAVRRRMASIAPEYLPRLDLDLRRGLYDRTDPQPTTAQRHGWSVGLTWEVPLGGAPRARQDELRARAELAEAELQRVCDQVQADAAAAREQARQTASAAPQLAQQRQRWDLVVRASELQFDAGRRSLMQLIDQYDRRFGVQQRDIDNAWQQAEAHLRLRRLAGDLAEWFGVLEGGAH
ncbi:TolC family protein [Pseudorhodoferax sp.]|uniref:TolC family protein n=1 Tax=Pseudorhodoferax sp. TaxID=1993553 RepID=UPI002DD68FDF|nr:TolC family protein [Pseudorhodoferax sp.]